MPKVKSWRVRKHYQSHDAFKAVDNTRLARPLEIEIYIDRLRDIATKACEEALQTKESFKGESINWGNFSCVTTEVILSHFGYTGYRFVLMEAAPDCPRIQEWMREKLEAMGFINVSVVTEW